jgi:hypothetical protein
METCLARRDIVYNYTSGLIDYYIDTYMYVVVSTYILHALASSKSVLHWSLFVNFFFLHKVYQKLFGLFKVLLIEYFKNNLYINFIA